MITVAHDRRVSSALLGGQPLIGSSARRTVLVHEGLLLGLSGLDGDVTTFAQEVVASLRLLELEAEAAGVGGRTAAIAEERQRLRPAALARLVSSRLYAQRVTSPYYVEPIIAGLARSRPAKPAAEPGFDEVVCGPPGDAMGTSEEEEALLLPYLCSQDSLGAPMVAKDFVCAGPCAPSLLGLCEALWEPGLSGDQLRDLAARVLVGAMERDCLSGVGAVVYLVTPDGLTVHEIPCSSD